MEEKGRKGEKNTAARTKMVKAKWVERDWGIV
jgi:hypothetical protein